MAEIKAGAMNGRSPPAPSVRRFIVQAAEVTGSVMELAELQIQLVKADAKSAYTSSIVAVVTVVLSGLFMMATLLMMLFGLAGLIANGLQADLATVQLILGASCAGL